MSIFQFFHDVYTNNQIITKQFRQVNVIIQSPEKWSIYMHFFPEKMLEGMFIIFFSNKIYDLNMCPKQSTRKIATMTAKFNWQFMNFRWFLLLILEKQ